ncbi:MAG TPA: VWA domain-containing protein [Thermoanaerobaculia bacterium]|nr:VWA domain-containing protein [Thermoanaerobaculia bacterium]
MRCSRPASALRPLFSLLAVATLLAGPAFAQAPAGQAAQPPADSFGETIDVRVVEVEVVVTDSQGNLVSGLGPEDFRLRVDGEVEPIDFFSEVRGGRLAPPAADAEGPTLPAAVDAAPGAARGTAYLVFMDDFFTQPRDRGRVLGRLQRDLAVLAPEDRVAIYRYDGKQLTELTGWTAPGHDLAAAIGRLEEMPARGTWQVFEGRDLESDVEICNHLERLRERTERMVAAAASALRVAPATERRRAALLLTGGWAYDPARLATPGACVQDVLGGAELFRPLTDTANQLGYALYPVDVPGFEGVSAGPDADASPRETIGELDLGEAPTNLPGGALGNPQDAVVTLGSEAPVTGGAEIDARAAEWEGHLTLRFLAEETGGRALINAAAADALSRVAADGRSYYQLAFQTDRRRDDQRHEVDVEVLHPGASVRARRSFLDDSRATAVARASEAALLLDRPAATVQAPGPGVPPPLQVAFGDTKRAGIGRVVLPVAMMIPLDALTVLREGDAYIARAEVLFGAIEPDGARSDLPAIPITWRGEQPPAPGSLQPFVTELKLRRGKQDLLVVVHDARGEAILTRRLELDL